MSRRHTPPPVPAEPRPRRLTGLAGLAAVALLAAAPPALAGAGDLDPGFGHGGRLDLPLAGTATGAAGATLADGRFYVAGSSGTPGAPARFAVSRFLPDGRRDGTFGDRGTVRPRLGPAA